MRRLVLLLLLLTVPFQAAVGSTGFTCEHRVQHAGADSFPAKARALQALAHKRDPITQPRAQAHAHGACPNDGRCDASQASGATLRALDVDAPYAAARVDGTDCDNEAGSCRLCSECSFSAAPVPESTPDVAPSPAVLRVSFYVDPAALRYAVDGPFRPPRTFRS